MFDADLEGLSDEEQETVSFAWGDRGELISDSESSDTLPISPRQKSVSLLDIGIGLAAATALLIGIYFALLSPDPIVKIERYPVSIPLKSNSL